MPARVVEEPLGVFCTFSNGRTFLARLTGLPNERLARDLADGLVQEVHPLGGLTSPYSVQARKCVLRHLVKKLHDQGFTGGAADLTRAHLLRYWLNVSKGREQSSRRLLAAYDRAATGVLRPEIRAHLEGRSLHAPTPAKPLEPYTETEWQRLTEVCRAEVDASWKAHKEALALAERGGDPRKVGLSRESLAWLLAAKGPMRGLDIDEYLQRCTATDLVRLGYPQLRDAMFPGQDATIAYRLLLGIYTGIVPDGIASLGVEDLEWAGDAEILLDYIKGRTGPESLHLPKRASRLLERWLEFSAPLRPFAPPEMRGVLWLRNTPFARGEVAVSPLPTNSKHNYIQRWVRERGLLGDDGEPLPIHRQRIRTTYENLLSRRGWTGRTTIDPNHTPGVEGDHYLSSHTPAQKDAIETIIEDSQADILRKALPPVVLGEGAAAQLVRDYPETLARLGLDDTAIAVLLSGEQDVFTASCSDVLAGLHGPKGKPCPARPWVCLMCPLALFMPRHAPNLLRLKAYFARQFRRMTTDQFLAVFGPYSHRLNEEILPRFAPGVLVSAACEVADEPHELPLRPEEIA